MDAVDGAGSGQIEVLTPSEAEIAQYTESVAAKRVNVGHGRAVVDDWDDNLFIVDLYENYLRAVQQGKRSAGVLVPHLGKVKVYNQKTYFEEWLGDSLKSLVAEKEDIMKAQPQGEREIAGKANMLDIRDRAERAIRKYLELPDHLRLIGV